MIQVACPCGNDELREIVCAAFERACGLGSVRSISYSELAINEFAHLQTNSKYTIWVLVDPPEELAPLLILALKTMVVKVIVFGAVSPSIAQFLGMQVSVISEAVINASVCSPAPTYQFSESEGFISYVKGLSEGDYSSYSRALCRYDYADEWNNLGFGAITVNGSIWSLSNCANVRQENALAYLVACDERLSAYCALWDYPQSSLLWFNRQVGPVDSYEWRLVEIYIYQYRFSEIPAWPVVSEIPYGYEGAVTMRLDCDEDVESARPLYMAYKEWKAPFSLALQATVLADPRHHQLPLEVMASGGAILSHTLTHAPNWGGSQEEAMREGVESAAIINQATEIIPKYAVSPFHQTPLYARLGLAQASYSGCIGGIIANDPDFVMARGGRPPYSEPDFIGHTQQCMLHGDCLLETGDPLAVYKQAFEQSFLSRTFFGYLDHPFSERYQYGWNDEDERINAHGQLIDYIRKLSDRVLFLNENDALDFMHYKSNIYIQHVDGALKVSTPPAPNKKALNVAIEYGENIYSMDSKGMVL
ncbi:polysaccharide deacetylase [Polynucleobacter sp. UK-Mo-2m-Kol15]|uniref:polysaccharide deacetylase n=1 Tax=Polynucleobacter sp. UK-Mo-2m-Kol15 TaxID=2576916 RepID=UPI001C0AFD6D|nr:polysaccharide deacetylase [Polynucleobacter sp. UK-Mo-2m-Kol15]MBU3574768.1 polysaccharide deacetylase [Polynucleobacter sp. UK-Mo-2m-Kol15]